MNESIAGIAIPDSAIAKAATQLVRDTESDLLYHHSRRVFLWAALTGERKAIRYDPELLYFGAMFHDMGLTPRYSSRDLHFEVGAPTLRAISCAVTAFPNTTSRMSGHRLRCTPPARRPVRAVDHRCVRGGIKRKPATTFGNVKADGLDMRVPGFRRTNFCAVILGSDWAGV